MMSGARPSGWARIETELQTAWSTATARGARPSGWARIETRDTTGASGDGLVAPGLRAGRGLKLALRAQLEQAQEVAPGLRAGRGLKLGELLRQSGSNL